MDNKYTDDTDSEPSGGDVQSVTTFSMPRWKRNGFRRKKTPDNSSSNNNNDDDNNRKREQKNPLDQYIANQSRFISSTHSRDSFISALTTPTIDGKDNDSDDVFPVNPKVPPSSAAAASTFPDDQWEPKSQRRTVKQTARKRISSNRNNNYNRSLEETTLFYNDEESAQNQASIEVPLGGSGGLGVPHRRKSKTRSSLTLPSIFPSLDDIEEQPESTLGLFANRKNENHETPPSLPDDGSPAYPILNIPGPRVPRRRSLASANNNNTYSRDDSMISNLSWSENGSSEGDMDLMLFDKSIDDVLLYEEGMVLDGVSGVGDTDGNTPVVITAPPPRGSSNISNRTGLNASGGTCSDFSPYHKKGSETLSQALSASRSMTTPLAPADKSLSVFEVFDCKEYTDSLRTENEPPAAEDTERQHQNQQRPPLQSLKRSLPWSGSVHTENIPPAADDTELKHKNQQPPSPRNLRSVSWRHKQSGDAAGAAAAATDRNAKEPKRRRKVRFADEASFPEWTLPDLERAPSLHQILDIYHSSQDNNDASSFYSSSSDDDDDDFSSDDDDDESDDGTRGILRGLLYYVGGMALVGGVTKLISAIRKSKNDDIGGADTTAEDLTREVLSGAGEDRRSIISSYSQSQSSELTQEVALHAHDAVNTSEALHESLQISNLGGYIAPPPDMTSVSVASSTATSGVASVATASVASSVALSGAASVASASTSASATTSAAASNSAAAANATNVAAATPLAAQAAAAIATATATTTGTAAGTTTTAAAVGQ